MRTQLYGVIAIAVGLAAAGMNPSDRVVASAATTPANSTSTVMVSQPANMVSPVGEKAAASPAELRRAQVDGAVAALAASVPTQSHEGALNMAFQAYYNYQAAHPDDVKNPYFYFVDYGLDSRTPRGYVFDMETLKLVDGPFIVAHGRGSSKSKSGVPTVFSNRSGAATTSLGLYVTQEAYGFTGHTGGRPYSSVGLRLKGVSGDFNDAARARGVVVHGAPYVTPKGAGRSEGCPAMEPSRAQHLIPLMANGGLVFLYSPVDTQWLTQDPWGAAAV